MYMHWKYNPYHPHIPYSPQVCTNLDLFTPIFNIIKMTYETFQLSHCLHFHAESGQILVLSHIHCQFLHAFCKVWSSGLSFKIRSHWYSSRSSISNCSSNSHFVVCFSLAELVITPHSVPHRGVFWPYRFIKDKHFIV